MAYPIEIYPTWTNADDFDGPEDYAAACATAEESYDLAQGEMAAADPTRQPVRAGDLIDDLIARLK